MISVQQFLATLASGQRKPKECLNEGGPESAHLRNPCLRICDFWCSQVWMVGETKASPPPPWRPLFENSPDRPENRFGLCWLSRIFVYCGMDGAGVSLFRKIPAPIKIKSALPPPPKLKYPPPKKTRNFVDMEVFLQKERRNSRCP